MSDKTQVISLKGQCIAEFLGTALFVFLGVGCVTALKTSGAFYSQWEISIIWGMAVALGVYLTAGISGAHLNPAVTLALWLFANFDRRKVLPFMLSQLSGGLVAAALVYLLYSSMLSNVELTQQIVRSSPESLSLAGAFSTYANPNLTISQAFLVEFTITGILMCMILALTDDGNGLPNGPLAPLLIGILVAVIGASFGPLTGFAMNPARDFGPKVVAAFAGWGEIAFTGGRQIPYVLVPLIAPMFGACCGAFIYRKLISTSLEKNTVK